MPNFLLDTNVLVAMIRDRTFEEKFQQRYSSNENLFAISVVVHGELESLAIQWNWGEKKKKELELLLKSLIIIPIKVKTILTAYAQIDAYSQGKLTPNLLPKQVSARNMGKNDLWIGATAFATGATLITLDKDFDHLEHVFLKLDRLSVMSIK